ncbi:Zinc-type alcohol dehydrogenase-like protein [Poriferisphaera corsica]|uniref:Zinc-type alcohol dehydrogenase-like protein n=1 Tax=Poriferisphaera corsica TaxID=2528020 RepID=A0A517YSE2_9BACT|nr:NAD(P)-dependent alcohol dehydrogenase [Poriferisphaera corsica]QDU33131.1 Zinc-type alcohol dehydrogenase-like protein [Poriferisphaera corsica]
MKAAIYKSYGPPSVLSVQDVPQPTPKPNQCLIRIIASSVTTGDTTIRAFKKIPLLFYIPARFMFGITKPRKQILGNQFSGIIESAGNNTSQFKTGDHVFGFTGTGFGANAQYICLPEKNIAIKPSNLTHEQAAIVPFGGITALYFLSLANLKPNQNILIIGATGAVGSFATQLAKHSGATVTAVCSQSNHPFAKSLGATHTIDYQSQSLDTLNQTYDVIFDTVGKSSYPAIKHILTPTGTYLTTTFGSRELLHMLLTKLTSKQRVICAINPDRQQDLITLRTHIEAGHISPFIDQTFTLGRIADAHTYVEQGHTKGAVAITIPSS